MTDTSKVSPEEIQEFLRIELGTGRTITFSDTRQIFQFDSGTGLFSPAETGIETRIQLHFGERATRYLVYEMLDTIRRLTFIKREETNNPNLIPFENGVFNLGKAEFQSFSPEVILFSKHPVFFNPEATCPAIERFLFEITEGEAKKIQALKRLAGYCFYRDYPIQKAFMLLGNGANGKSVYLSVLTAMLGRKNVSGQTLQALAENRFSASYLYNKNANVFADLESKALRSTGIFKILTGGDYLEGEKKYHDAFQFKNHAKLLFSCNQLPRANDESDAFYRRWLIISFTRTFKVEEQDRELVSKLCTPQELGGFANIALTELRNLLREGIFGLDSETNTEAIRETYIRNSDSAKAFCYDRLELSLNEFETKELIRQEYLSYCKQNKLPMQTDKAFARAITNFFEGQAYDGRATMLGQQVKAWRGLKIKKQEEKAGVADFA